MKMKQEKDYEIIIAGKKRIIPEVTFVEATANGWKIHDSEWLRINKISLIEDCQSKEYLTLVQADAIFSTLNKSPRDFYQAFIKAKGVSYDDWMEVKRQYQQG